MKIALLLFLFPSVAFADVTLFIDINCSGPSYTASTDLISNFKGLRYTYSCTKMLGEHVDYEGTCVASFNDRVSSVEITENESVVLFKHAHFFGTPEHISRVGCHNLEALHDEASSLAIE